MRPPLRSDDRGGAEGMSPLHLPAVVREGLVGLGHAEDVVLALVGAALLGLGVHELVGEALGHRLLAAIAGELDQPADGEGAGARGGHLDRDLVGRAADAAGAGPRGPRPRLYRELERPPRLPAPTPGGKRPRATN